MAVSDELGDFPLGVHAHPCQRCWQFYAEVTEDGELIAVDTLNFAKS